MIAACTERGIFAHAVDAAGRDAGYTEPVLAGYPVYDCDGQSPVLAERPGAGPLALWQNGYGVMMSMIAADGLSWSAAKTIVEGGVAGGEFLAAAWVGDAFAVAVPIESDTPGIVGALRLLRVLPDGTTSELGDYFEGSGARVASIANGPDAHDIRITFETDGPDGGAWYWRYDAQAPVGPVRINQFGYGGASGPGVAFGDGLALFFGRPSGAGYAITRLDADGVSSGPVREAARMPYGFADRSRQQIVRRGPDVVFPFSGPGEQLYLARVTP